MQVGVFLRPALKMAPFKSEFAFNINSPREKNMLKDTHNVSYL